MRTLNLPRNLPRGDSTLSQLPSEKKRTERADIDPMEIDRSITWESVGGLDHHIRALKEMVVLPLLYPEVFEKFNVSPPKGVIFYGPPGTGKTLVARALANTCSNAGQPVAFFMRKGADCLSKWVGEAEKQLRLLFENAKKHQPSIIFFDEIDGLAPVRSSKQDYIHSSIVSTLLALMDGLDARGKVIVIGATNRIDALDPALRRPGRFDRELIFTLPSKKSRKHIFEIHTKNWNPPFSEDLKEYISTRCVGYCGADIKALCSESALNALRRRYPQIYLTDDKLLIDVANVEIAQQDFVDAMKTLTPAAHRSAIVNSRPLPQHLFSCGLGEQLNQIIDYIKDEVFPVAKKSLERHQQLFLIPDNRASTTHNNDDDNHTSNNGLSMDDPYDDILECIGEDNNILVNDYLLSAPSFRPWLLIHGKRDMGQDYLLPAVLHALEEFPVFSLGMPSLLSNPTIKTPEEGCVLTFAEARRNSPCVVFIPRLDEWWQLSSDLLRSTFTELLADISASSQLHILLLGTSNVPYDELPDQVQDIFAEYTYALASPTQPDIQGLIQRISDDVKRVAVTKQRRELINVADFPRAPKPKPKPKTAEELNREAEKKDTMVLELRILMRELVMRLCNDRKFHLFTKSVDENQAPDYYSIIKNPVCLFDILDNLDTNKYTEVDTFLKDIQLIATNAREYNDENVELGRRIISRAQQLYEMALRTIRHWDHKLVDETRKIAEMRKLQMSDRSSSTSTSLVPSLIASSTLGNGDGETSGSAQIDKGKGRATITIEYAEQSTKERSTTASTSSSSSSSDVPSLNRIQNDITCCSHSNSKGERSPPNTEKMNEHLPIDCENHSPSEQEEETTPVAPSSGYVSSPEHEEPAIRIVLDSERLDNLLDRLKFHMKDMTLAEIDRLHSKIYKSILRFRSSPNKNQLLTQLEQTLQHEKSAVSRNPCR